MNDIPADALLREALAWLNDRPNFRLCSDARASSHRLAARIEAYLTHRSAVQISLRDRARHDRAHQPDLRFAPPADTAVEQWVPVWIRSTANQTGSSLLPALAAAVAALPPMTRAVYLIHRDRQLAYPAIAAELGIEIAEVQRHIATALVRLDEALCGASAGGSETGGGHDRPA
jgi:DNA-directed RNA polymerase specialized sigma24 family protein